LAATVSSPSKNAASAFPDLHLYLFLFLFLFLYLSLFPMGLGGSPELQVMLLPARTAVEASAWGSAAMEYAAAFDTVHFARDPERVDWRGYQSVSILRPGFWPDDLPLLIKQANPTIRLDVIQVDTPDALRLVLHVRVYYGWRYGPQGEFDWAQLWPPGQCLIGLHGRADGELQPADYPVVKAARLEAMKITSHATLETVNQLRAINPHIFIMVRAFTSFGAPDAPRRVTPQDFVEWTTPDLARLYDADPAIRYVEIHNEPNVRAEGLGANWQDGKEFGDWFLEVLALYRLRFPEALFGFPGLSPGPTSASEGRLDSEEFLAQAIPAAQQADWVGLHAYWVNEREFNSGRLGLNFTHYRNLFPEKMLFLTEFGNPAQPKHEVADQYSRYFGLLRGVLGLGAAFAYIISSPDPAESALWGWRDEAGKDAGIAGIVGQRKHILSAAP
jgi:hypothetical protein